MKTLFRLALGVFVFPAGMLNAQEAVPSPTAAAPTALAPTMAAPATADGRLTDEQLEQLLGPIALYPDALIALILPACTEPADIVLAARHLRQNGSDRSQIESRAWDESVKSLTNYPEVLKWLDDNLTWTKQVGEAFAEQPAEVLKAVQRLRARAQASGALVNNPQQQVLVDASVIRIVPAQPDVIYVPYYDPTIVYVSQPVTYVSRHPLVSFGIGCRVGSWLCNDFNWTHGTLWVGDRRRPWNTRHDWRQPVVSVTSVTIVNRPSYAGRAPRPWSPPPRHFRPTVVNASPVHQGAPAGAPPNRSITRPAYRTTPTVDVASAPAPTPVERPEMFRHIGNGNGAAMGPQPVASAPATSAPQVSTSTPSFRTRAGDASRSADAPARPRGQQPALASPAPSVSSQSAPIPTVAPLHIAGGRTAPSYPTVQPAPQPQMRASAPVVSSSPPVTFSRGGGVSGPQPVPQAAPAPAPAQSSAAPAPAAPASRGGGGQQEPDRPGRDRRNID